MPARPTHRASVFRAGVRCMDVGPSAGTASGKVVFEGTVDGLRASGTLTGCT